MKLWIFSDRHLEYPPLREPLVISDADVCVVAGDLCRGPANGVRWLAEHIAPSMPCVYVAGNHEFYKGSIREGLEGGRKAAQEFRGVHFLENDAVTIGGIQFVGATLWTDYRIEGHQLLAMRHARERMNDYRQMALQRKPWQRFVPEAAARMHQDSRRFIENALSSASIPTVVVTHHLPHPASLPDRFNGDLRPTRPTSRRSSRPAVRRSGCTGTPMTAAINSSTRPESSAIRGDTRRKTAG